MVCQGVNIHICALWQGIAEKIRHKGKSNSKSSVVRPSWEVKADNGEDVALTRIHHIDGQL